MLVQLPEHGKCKQIWTNALPAAVAEVVRSEENSVEQGSEKAGSELARADGSIKLDRAGSSRNRAGFSNISTAFSQIFSEILRNSEKKSWNFREKWAKSSHYSEILRVCAELCKIFRIFRKIWNPREKNIVDLEKSWKMRPWSWNSALIRPKTSRLSSRWLEPAW